MREEESELLGKIDGVLAELETPGLSTELRHSARVAITDYLARERWREMPVPQQRQLVVEATLGRNVDVLREVFDASPSREVREAARAAISRLGFTMPLRSRYRGRENGSDS